MQRRTLIIAALIAATLVGAGAAIAQFPFSGRRGGGGFGGGYRREVLDVRDAANRNGVPEWTNDERFKSDVFTFTRIRYSSGGGRGYGGYGGYGRGGGSWATDYPDSDLNFSYRLQELTSLETDPNGRIIDLTDEALFDYPFLYMIEPGRMYLEDAEVKALRKYLLNGGFLMVDDFWGDRQWENLYQEMKRVFPEREPVDLPLSHEIFHLVYDLKQKPQVPSIRRWGNGLTSEVRPGDGDPGPHYRALYDDKGRMMALICHNTDLGDGWEREGESPEYFKEMSERWSYPMGINIIAYAMTH